MDSNEEGMTFKNKGKRKGLLVLQESISDIEPEINLEKKYNVLENWPIYNLLRKEYKSEKVKILQFCNLMIITLAHLALAVLNEG